VIVIAVPIASRQTTIGPSLRSLPILRWQKKSQKKLAFGSLDNANLRPEPCDDQVVFVWCREAFESHAHCGDIVLSRKSKRDL
jgi:hypothetical protein